MQLNSQNATLVVVPRGDLIAGDRVAAHPSTVGAATFGILSAFPGEPVERSRPVRLVPVEQAPHGIVAVGRELAETLGLLPTDEISDSSPEAVPVTRAPWELRVGGVTCQRAQEVLLEITAEHQLEEAVEELNGSEDLAGQLLWVHGQQVGQSLTLEVGGRPYRVRELMPAPTGGNVIVEITPETRMKVFAPGFKAGTDIVILADCSGSMGIDDLTEQVEPTPQQGFAPRAQTIKRMEALRRALRNLLDTRLRVSGSLSRIALVSFTTVSRLRFPREGGMAEMDENAPPTLVQEFRDAINLLQEENAPTDIGQAIYQAAELLYRCGRPGNERLIVLISDGANWRPKGVEATGEVVVALKEPVSLMEHLHREMKIHLHAIGISTREIYRQYFHKKYPTTSFEHAEPAAVPNHDLLEQLVLVGGGDPTQTGDTTVLHRYLTGLGAGVTRHLRNPRPAPTPPLSRYEATLLTSTRKPAPRVTTRADVADELRELRDEIKRLRKACNGYMRALVQRHMFKTTDMLLEAFERYMVTEVQSSDDFKLFINNLNQCFCETVDDNIYERSVQNEPPPIPAITDILHGPDMDVITVLRNYHFHDKERALGEAPPANGKQRRGHRRNPADDVSKHSEILQQLVNDIYIEEHDSQSWSLLQRRVLIKLRDVLKQIREEFKSARSAAPAPDAEQFPCASGFIWKW